MDATIVGLAHRVQWEDSVGDFQALVEDLVSKRGVKLIAEEAYKLPTTVGFRLACRANIPWIDLDMTDDTTFELRGSIAVQKPVRITSTGQITVPRDIRRALGVGPGDRLLFESDSKGVRVRPMRAKSPFEKCRGIGNPGMPSGRKAVRQRNRQLRGQ